MTENQEKTLAESVAALNQMAWGLGMTPDAFWSALSIAWINRERPMEEWPETGHGRQVIQ